MPLHNRDPHCVFVGTSPALADVAVTLLGSHGIQTQVMDRATLGGLLGLTPLSASGVSSDGVEIWVINLDDAEKARRIIDEQNEQWQERLAEKKELGPVDAECDSCGKHSMYAGEFRGTVQVCTHCGKYLDVPGDDGEFDWSGIEESGEFE